MRVRACLALLLAVSACVTPAPVPRAPEVQGLRLVHLRRAAALPWTDEGRCAVQYAAQPWPVLVERCYSALDQDRLEFHDVTGRCALASTGAVAVGLGVCILVAPEVVVGAVVVTGVVVLGLALQEALAASEKRGRPQAGPVLDTRPRPETQLLPREPSPRKRPAPGPKGTDFPPPAPPRTSDRDRHRCEPVPVRHLGGNPLHDQCADRVPNNSFPGGDVLVNGKNFDALQLATRTLWEVKTDNFDAYPDALREIVLSDQVPALQLERELAGACGFDFRIGVRSAAHKTALELAFPDFDGIIVVMDWC